MKYSIMSLLSLCMIFSYLSICCGEKQPFKAPGAKPMGKSSPLFTVHKIDYITKDKANGEQWSEKMPRKFTSPKTSPRNTGN